MVLVKFVKLTYAYKLVEACTGLNTMNSTIIGQTDFFTRCMSYLYYIIYLIMICPRVFRYHL